jgi:hypothetical protein
MKNGTRARVISTAAKMVMLFIGFLFLESLLAIEHQRRTLKAIRSAHFN